MTSLSPNPRSDQFEINIPYSFFKEEIISKYDKLLNLHPQVFTSFADIVNESVQEFEMPLFGYQPITQENLRNDFSTSPQYYRSNANAQNLSDKLFTIRLRHSDGYLTYFLMLEHFFAYYNDVDQMYAGNWNLQTFLSSGSEVFTLNFTNVLFIGISKQNFTYAGQESTFQNFELVFGYSKFDTEFDLPDITNKFDRQPKV